MENVKKIFTKIAAIILVFCLSLFAQNNIQFSYLTAEDGLSLSGVTQIFQDSKGFLWFGTYNGLNRYDGYNFRIFLPEPSNPKSISSHQITSICEDHEGYLWIGTNKGLNRFDSKTEEFERYFNVRLDSNSLSHSLIYAIFEDKSGILWIGTFDGLNKYNRKRNNFTRIKNEYDYKQENPTIYSDAGSITSIAEDYKKNLWIGTWNGLSCIKENGKMIKHLPGDFFTEGEKTNSISYREVSAILEDHNKNLWIGTNGSGIDLYDQAANRFTHFENIDKDPNSLSNNYINVIFQDGLNNIWIGTKNGLNKYDHRRNNFVRFQHNYENTFSLINDEVLSINEDRSGLMWIGTSAGVSRFCESKNKFDYYQEGKENPEYSLSSNRVNSMFIDKKNNIWIGTLEGLDEIKPNDDRIYHYKHDTKNSNSLSNNFVTSVMEDHLGTIWIGTNNDGLNNFDPQTGRFKHFFYNSDNESSLSNMGVISLCEDHNGVLWVGTWWGLNRFERASGKFKRYIENNANPNSLKQNLIWVIYEDSKGMLWLGTDGGGVSEFNPKTDTFVNFLHDSTNNNSISGNRVISIYESHDGMMWFGTTEGLNSYNRKTGKFNIYDKESGLPGVLINGIKEDDKDYLWIVSENGLSRFDRKNRIFTNFTKRNGLQSLEFSPNVSSKSKDGQLYFGCNTGLLHFNPDDIQIDYLSAPVVFTDLKIYNQSVPILKDGILKESVTRIKSINIPSGNDVITMDFALLDYFNVRNNKFRYKLEGFDIDWNEVGSRNTATYTNLPPGQYKFMLNAYNSDGIKNAAEASIKINILPSFYQTWLFKFALASGLVLITILFIQQRTRKIRKQNKILEGRVIERTKDLDRTIYELNQEILDRKKAEDKVQASLKEKDILIKDKDNLLSEKGNLLGEKEVLLKEIHHRVKNNLQIISSLLYLNSKKIKDKDALNMFKESQNRVKSIALVHERLYRSHNLSKIDFKEYVQHLTNDLFKSYAVNSNGSRLIKMEINIRDIFINVELAVPCGLIINEIISNSLKYAFPENGTEEKEGIIKINFNKNEEDEFDLTVSDNGIGMPEGINEKKKLSLGLQLVETLVNQLEGTLEICSDNGAVFKIKFK